MLAILSCLKNYYDIVKAAQMIIIVTVSRSSVLIRSTIV